METGMYSFLLAGHQRLKILLQMISELHPSGSRQYDSGCLSTLIPMLRES